MKNLSAYEQWLIDCENYDGLIYWWLEEGKIDVPQLLAGWAMYQRKQREQAEHKYNQANSICEGIATQKNKKDWEAGAIRQTLMSKVVQGTEMEKELVKKANRLHINLNEETWKNSMGISSIYEK